MDDVPRFEAADAGAWAAWLADHHDTMPAVWLVFRKQGAPGGRSLTWGEAVEEALCWGWIDSRVRSIDEHRYEQYFTPRSSSSAWSGLNKTAVERLEAAGRMRPPGRRAIDAAKENGMWSVLDDAEALVVPPVLADAFDGHPGAAEGFASLSESKRKGLLAWIALAKRDTTKERRAERIAAAAVDGELPAGLG